MDLFYHWIKQRKSDYSLFIIHFEQRPVMKMNLCLQASNDWLTVIWILFIIVSVNRAKQTTHNNFVLALTFEIHTHTQLNCTSVAIGIIRDVNVIKCKKWSACPIQSWMYPSNVIRWANNHFIFFFLYRLLFKLKMFNIYPSSDMRFNDVQIQCVF